MSINAEIAKQVLAKAECCYTQQQVEAALDRMAAEIAQRLADHNPLVLCVMNGGLIAMAELLLRLPFPLQYDYIHATRYQNEVRGNDLTWLAEPTISLQNRHVLIIDDILDEGLTLAAIVEYCQNNGAQTVETAVLVDKRHNRKHFSKANYVGVEVNDRYVFGYGMDYKGYLRNVNGIYALGEDA